MLEVWATPIDYSSFAIALFNRSPGEDTIIVNWKDVGLVGPYAVRDVWANKNRGVYENIFGATVPSHSTTLLILTPRPLDGNNVLE